MKACRLRVYILTQITAYIFIYSQTYS